MEQHQNQPQTQQPAQPIEPKKKASKGKKIWLIIGIVAAVFLISGLVLYYWRNSIQQSIKREENMQEEEKPPQAQILNGDSTEVTQEPSPSNSKVPGI